MVLVAFIGFVLGFAPLAHGGTVYVANEVSNTVSVIDTKTNAIIATIGLGSDAAIPGTPQPDGPFNGETQHHNPFYNGHVGTHGLWVTADGAILLVANRISGTIAATVRPGGREGWVAVRGENHIAVLELNRDRLMKAGIRRNERMKTVATIDTVRGPSMVSFTSDGRFAFVCAGKEDQVHKIDARTRKIVARQKVPAAFSPFCLVSPDDQELFIVHKGAQKLSILRTRDLSFVQEGMPIGPCANHVFFVGKLAYVTVGGAPPCAPGGVDREGKIAVVDRTTHKVVHELTGPVWTGDPHGIWGSSDGRLYVGHERGNRVTIINTGNPDDALDDKVEGTVTGSARDLGFMKQPIDVVVGP